MLGLELQSLQGCRVCHEGDAEKLGFQAVAVGCGEPLGDPGLSGGAGPKHCCPSVIELGQNLGIVNL